VILNVITLGFPEVDTNFKPLNHECIFIYERIKRYGCKAKVFDLCSNNSEYKSKDINIYRLKKLSTAGKVNFILQNMERKDSIIVSHWLDYSSFVASIVKAFSGLKLVSFAHGGDVIVNKKINYGARRSLSKRIMVYFSIALSDRIICVSNHLKKLVNRIKKNNKTNVILNGVDLKLFSRAKPLNRKKFNLKKNDFVVASLGNLVPKNGFSYLIKSMKYVDESVRCVIGGEGRLKNELVQLVKKENLSSKVSFCGRIPEKGKASFFKMCDAFIVPSVEEGFGMVAIESMASGVPVIASNVGGLKEIIQNNENGILFNRCDERDLSEKIKFIFENKKQRIKFSRAGIKRARDFDWKKTIKMEKQVFEEVGK